MSQTSLGTNNLGTEVSLELHLWSTHTSMRGERYQRLGFREWKHEALLFGKEYLRTSSPGALSGQAPSAKEASRALAQAGGVALRTGLCWMITSSRSPGTNVHVQCHILGYRRGERRTSWQSVGDLFVRESEVLAIFRVYNPERRRSASHK